MTHIHPPCYKFSRQEIARHKCIGCGVNVIKIGDYCMLSGDIWKRKLHLEWSDNMCIACIEAGIGRKLRPLFRGDFDGWPTVEGFPMSDVLRNRLGFDDATRLAKEQRTERHKLAKRKAKRHAARTLRPVTATKAKPWVVAGISRSGWYAKKKLAP
jgi:hypothetical protein